MASKIIQPIAPPTAAKPFFGHGGSYRLDPASGETTLIERAGYVAPAIDPDPASATPSSTPAQE